MTLSACGNRAWNGTSSCASSCASLRCKTGKAKWESVVVSPCPGKCFTLLSAPPCLSPRKNARPNRMTRAGSSPNERVFTMGLSGLSAKSNTGAKIQSTPKLRACRAVINPFSKARFSSLAAPKAILEGKSGASGNQRPRPSS